MAASTAIKLTAFGGMVPAVDERLLPENGAAQADNVWLYSGALEGITRHSIMTIARDLGYEVVEANLLRSDLYLADEAFLTGTAAEVVPISSVDDRIVGTGKPGPVTSELQSKYFKIVRGEVPAYASWLTVC